jgi:hypothetical protein
MSQLIKYEAACRALAECKSVDEAKEWADKAAAMQAYGRMAKDKTLEVDAAEIRIRAERRLGEMIAATKADGGLSRGAAGAGINQHTPNEVRSLPTTAPKLSDAGISKDLSSRAQKLAAVPEAEFEAELAAKRERDRQEGTRVSARLQAAGERAQKAEKINETPEAPEDYTDLDAARDQISELQIEVTRLSDRLAVESYEASEDEKTAVSKIIAELRSDVQSLTAQLAAVTISRDTYMEENAQMKAQMKMQRREIEKLKSPN